MRLKSKIFSIKNTRGVALSEYALLVSLVSFAALTVVGSYGQSVNDTLKQLDLAAATSSGLNPSGNGKGGDRPSMATTTAPSAGTKATSSGDADATGDCRPLPMGGGSSTTCYTGTTSGK